MQWLTSAALVDSPSYKNSLVEIRGANLAEALEASFGDRDRATLIERMAMSSGIKPGTVEQILMGEIDLPPRQRLESFSMVLGVPISRLVDAVIQDGGKPEEYRRRRIWL